MAEAKRHSKRMKKISALFTDEPELVHASMEMVEETIADPEEADEDRELRRILAATRREHLVHRETTLDTPVPLVPMKGRSLDFLLSESAIETGISVSEKQKMQEMQEMPISSRVDMDIGDGLDMPTTSMPAEPLVRRGVAATLALLKLRGVELQTRSYYRPGVASDTHEIQLEYFDKEGHSLTAKEAYKELSRRFHGKAPGKGKIDKMQRRRAEQQRQATAATAVDSVMTRNMRQQQEATGSAFVVLSGQRQKQSAGNVVAVAPSTAPKAPRIFGLQIKKR